VPKSERPKAASPYVNLLLEYRDSAKANIAFDVYGYAGSDYPDSQKAAINGFCVVVNDVRTDSERTRFSDPAYFSKRVVTAARSEVHTASMASVRRAVAKLQAIVEPESLDPPLVKSYAKACY
jgi:hypothetical protein